MFPGVLLLGFPRPAEHMAVGVPPVLKPANLFLLFCSFPKERKKKVPITFQPADRDPGFTQQSLFCSLYLEIFAFGQCSTMKSFTKSKSASSA